MTNVSTKSTAGAPAARTVPEIDPQLAQWNSGGFVIREMVARLPVDATAEHLKEPGLWRRVQMDRNRALRKLDRVIIVAHDESFLWDAYVAEAGPDFVTLSTPKRHELKPRHGSYYADDLYRVQWAGAGFVVVRKRDGHVMTPTMYFTEQEAIRELHALYPKAVAS